MRDDSPGSDARNSHSESIAEKRPTTVKPDLKADRDDKLPDKKNGNQSRSSTRHSWLTIPALLQCVWMLVGFQASGTTECVAMVLAANVFSVYVAFPSRGTWKAVLAGACFVLIAPLGRGVGFRTVTSEIGSVSPPAAFIFLALYFLPTVLFLLAMLALSTWEHADRA